jgi:hypothetical protein
MLHEDILEGFLVNKVHRFFLLFGIQLEGLLPRFIAYSSLLSDACP